MGTTIDFARSRQNMVDGQIRPNGIIDQRVIDAMAAVPREAFVPATKRSVAYIDEDLALGNGRYLVEPVVIGRMLQALALDPSAIVLEIGAGTGYVSAVLARLAATVIALEQDQELAGKAQETLLQLGIDNVVNLQASLADGYAEQAPFDAILIEGAVAEVPQGLIDQLSENGRLVCVRRQPRGLGRVTLVRRDRGVVSSLELFDAATPYLPGFEPVAAFQF